MQLVCLLLGYPLAPSPSSPCQSITLRLRKEGRQISQPSALLQPVNSIQKRLQTRQLLTRALGSCIFIATAGKGRHVANKPQCWLRGSQPGAEHLPLGSRSILQLPFLTCFTPRSRTGRSELRSHLVPHFSLCGAPKCLVFPFKAI